MAQLGLGYAALALRIVTTVEYVRFLDNVDAQYRDDQLFFVDAQELTYNQHAFDQLMGWYTMLSCKSAIVSTHARTPARPHASCVTLAHDRAALWLAPGGGVRVAVSSDGGGQSNRQVFVRLRGARCSHKDARRDFAFIFFGVVLGVAAAMHRMFHTDLLDFRNFHTSLIGTLRALLGGCTTRGSTTALIFARGDSRF